MKWKKSYHFPSQWHLIKSFYNEFSINKNPSEEDNMHFTKTDDNCEHVQWNLPLKQLPNNELSQIFK